jgi:type IV pilus assembly protein PilB
MAEKGSLAQKKLGDILLDCQVITPAQVDAALAEQRRSGKLFGEALLDLGFVSEEDLGWALSAQLDIPYIDLSPDMVDAAAVSLLGPELMRRLRVLPLVRVGNTLTVAVADPTNRDVARDLGNATGLEIRQAVASPRRISQILEEILGPEERPVEESGDILFREITRPGLDDGGGGPGRANPLGLLFSTALRERIGEIHLEPSGDAVRVRFRRDGRLEDQPPISPGDYQAILSRLRVALASEATSGAGLASRRARVEFAAGTLEMTVTLVPGAAGEVLVIEMRSARDENTGIGDLGLDPGEVRDLRILLAEPSGLIVVAGASGCAPTCGLNALIREIDAAGRRVVALGSGLAPRREGVLQVPDEAGGSSEELREHFLAAQYVDVLILDHLTAGPDFDRVMMAATRGKLVLAGSISPDALACLATTLERGASRALLRRGLRGVLEVGQDAAGRPAAALLRLSGRLAAAVEEGGSLARLETAARADGFHPLRERDRADQATPIIPALDASGRQPGLAAA